MTFLPKLTGWEVADELERAHLYCLPSLIENSPNSLAEAMVVGTPTVTTYTGGVPSMFDSSMGEMVPICDDAMLAQSMVRIFKDDGYAPQISEISSRVARCRHDAETIAMRMREIYHLVVAKGG